MNSHDLIDNLARPLSKRRAIAPPDVCLRVCLLVGILGLALFLWTSAVRPAFAHRLLQTTPPHTHTVQQGETLSQIAEKYHVALNVLMFYNGISEPNDIYVGQNLELPPPATPTPADTYQVKAGETLSQIAEAQHVALDELMQLNDISNPDSVYRGQMLHLPSKNLTRTATPTATATSARGIATQSTTATTATPTPTETTAIPTPTATSTIVQTSATRAATYTVQAGETLSQIAEAQAVNLAELMQLNDISNANTIYQGQVLRLPSDPASSQTATDTPTNMPTETATPTATATDTPTAETTAATNTPEAENAASPINPIASLNQTYVASSGDTLSRIALHNGVDLEALRRINHMSGQNYISVGMTLTLPATGNELHVPSHEQQYVVQPGDSLGRIAQQFDRTLTEMLLANYLSNPNDIYPGQSLIIPKQAVASKPAVQVGPPRRGFYYYKVQSGDTLSQIGQRFDSNGLAILDYNDLPNAETVYSGLEVRIPFGPPPLPVQLPPAPASGTRFMVSVSRQQCLIFQGSRIVYTWPCSTGYGVWKTRIGTFAVQSMFDIAKSQAYQLDMPFWLGIYNVGTYENGIHGLPTRWDNGKKLWEGLIGQPATFGCAMLDDENAKKLYQMAYIGMQVYIVN